jgi:2C-methyl-D-erythritol 2,4-cyclodiphosphate synthase
MNQKPARAAVICKWLIEHTANLQAQSEADKIVHALIEEKIGAVIKQ